MQELASVLERISESKLRALTQRSRAMLQCRKQPALSVRFRGIINVSNIST